jgi:hypothetical protein
MTANPPSSARSRTTNRSSTSSTNHNDANHSSGSTSTTIVHGKLIEQPGRSSSPSSGAPYRALIYACFNVASASGIVFANKAVFAVHHFNFTYTLTLTHTLVTVLGMWAFARVGLFQARQLPLQQVRCPPTTYVIFRELQRRY